MLTTKEANAELVRLFDIIARLIQITLIYNGSFISMTSITGFDDYYDSVCHTLLASWEEGFNYFLVFCESRLAVLLADIEKEDAKLGQCVAEATAIIIFIDQKITYNDIDYDSMEEFNSNERIYASCLFEKSASLYWRIGHLNSDNSLKETGIWINPKFDSGFVLKDESLGKERPLGNRDSFFHLNASLVHMRFFNQNERNVSVENIVLKSFKPRSATGLRIGFAPLCSWSDNLLQIEKVRITEGIFEKNGFRIKGINGENDILNRFQKDLWHAAKEGIDILFFPEMLGTERMIDRKNDYSLLLRKTFINITTAGLTPPAFLIFPSLWKDRSNIAFAALIDGKITGGFRKTVPYCDHEYGMEDLEEQEQADLLIVHIPGVTCMSAMICAQFLSDDKRNNSDILFSCLGTDLLLVSSFSPGERDFANKINHFQHYGALVIWGNCCGAVKGIH